MHDQVGTVVVRERGAVDDHVGIIVRTGTLWSKGAYVVIPLRAALHFGCILRLMVNMWMVRVQDVLIPLFQARETRTESE